MTLKFNLRAYTQQATALSGSEIILRFKNLRSSAAKSPILNIFLRL